MQIAIDRGIDKIALVVIIVISFIYSPIRKFPEKMELVIFRDILSLIIG